MKNIILLLAISVWANFLYAQPHVNWLNYSFSQRVTDIDINGEYLWISTQGGLVKYNKKTDEKTFYNRANSNLPDNNLLGVFCGENGEVWISSKYYGIGKFNGSSCIIYNQSNSGLPFDQLNTKIKMDKNGNVWISSFRWMVKYDGQNWKTWITGSDLSAWPLVSDFDITDDGIVWLYSTDGIGKIENEEYSIVSTIGSGLISKIGFVKVDNEGTVWVAIENEGIYKYDGTSFTNYSTSNSCLPSNSIYSISFDQENTMWLATAIGLVKFTISGCQLYKPASPDTALLCLKADGNDTIWCGCLNGNLLRFDGSTFTSIDLSNSPLLSNYILDILADTDSNVWVATSKNVVKKTNNNIYSVFNKQGNAFAQDKDGAIWVAFGNGDTCLLKIEGNGNTVFDSLNSPFNKKTINHLKVDNNNHLWASTNYGLFKYDGTSFTNYNTANSGIPSNGIFEIAFDKNNILWGGSAMGLFRFDGENWTVWDRTNSNIPTNVVNRLIIDSEDNIWFSCMDEDRIVGIEYGGGLTKFDGQIFETYNISNSGLRSNTIFGLLDDGVKLWIATYAAGLMSFDKIGKWEAFDVTNSGIANNMVQGLAKDKNGSIWMGHIDAGVSVFNPDSVLQTVGLINGRVANFNSRLVIYPNPVKNELFVKLDLQNEKIVKAGIYDVSGKLMQVIPENLFKFNNSIYSFQIQPGLPENQILILSLKAKNGNVFNGKFIISK